MWARLVLGSRKGTTQRVPVLTIIGLACFQWSAAALAHTTSPGNVSWKLVWADEFDGTTLNASAWNIRTNESHCCGPAGGNGELELYLPEEVSVQGGQLVLRTRHRVPGVRDPSGRLWNYTSGWVDTSGKVAFKGGRFEANCSMPSRDATGIWPAFWLMPEPSAKQCWPTGGEVDIFEFNGNWIEDEIFGSYHWAEPGSSNCGKDKAPIPGKGIKPHGAAVDWQTEWHVYAVEWFEDRLDFYLDSELYFTRTADQVDLPTAPMYVIFDQAVDSWLFPPATGPAKYGDGVFLRVDYVRYFVQDGNAP